jgi:uncharacterized protein (TIGR03435 family)
MMQKLLEERFQLKLHLENREMPIYELTAAEHGVKLKPSSANGTTEPEDPWGVAPKYTLGRDGYPVFAEGSGGLVGPNGHYCWVGFGVSMEELTKTLSFQLGRPVVDATGLGDKYDIDMRWWIDTAYLLERAGHKEEAAALPDTGPEGPPLTRAVQDQLGLKLVSKKGIGEIVVVDHVKKVPTAN